MLAEIADVKRVLKLTTTTAEQDQTIQEWIDTAESRVTPLLQDFETTSGTTSFYDVTAPARLDLTTRGSTVTAVRGYAWPTGSAHVFSGNELTTTERFVELEYPGYYERLEIDWEYAAGVPQAVRDGVAMYAAYLMSRSQASATGIKSERIGDYSYTISDVKLTSAGIPEDAWFLLKPFRRRRSVLTTGGPPLLLPRDPRYYS